MAQRGGKRENAGRKPIIEEQQKNFIIQQAVNGFYNAETDDDGKKSLIIDLLSFERGKMFVAEHLLGKPKETRDITLKEFPTIDMNEWK